MKNTRRSVLHRALVVLWAGWVMAIGLSAAPIPASSSRAQRGMVATVQPLATEAGVEAIRQGGNAVDAAIAAALTLGVFDGHNSGLGGGCFFLIHLADGSVVAL